MKKYDYIKLLKNKFLLTIKTKYNKVILFNRTNGAIFTLTENEYERITQNKVVNTKLIDELFESGILNFEKIVLHDEYDNFLITIELSTLCNLKCPYCYQRNNKPRKEISETTLNYIFDYIGNVFKTNDNLEYIIIGFIGGEPMLHKSKLIKIIEKINDMVKKLKKKVYYHIDTNGTIDFSDIFNNFKHIELSITLSNKIDHNKNRPSSNFDSYESIFSNLRKCYNKANKLSIRYNTNHENINDFEHFVKKIKKELPIVYNIDAMYTDNYEYNSDFDNKLNISEFTKWNSSKAIDILIKYNYPITGSISSKLQLCSAYQPFSCKIHSDGFVTLCDSMEYSNQLNIKDLSLDINMLDIVFNKYKKYNPTMDIHCKECSQIVQCQGQLLCRTDKCKYQKRYDEKLFIAKFVEYSLKDKADFFTGM